MIDVKAMISLSIMFETTNQQQQYVFHIPGLSRCGIPYQGADSGHMD